MLSNWRIADPGMLEALEGAFAQSDRLMSAVDETPSLIARMSLSQGLSSHRQASMWCFYRFLIVQEHAIGCRGYLRR